MMLKLKKRRKENYSEYVSEKRVWEWMNMANTNQSVEMRECLRSKENGGSGEAEAQVCSCRFTWEGTFLQSSHDNSRQHNIQIGFALQCIFLRKISR